MALKLYRPSELDTQAYYSPEHVSMLTECILSAYWRIYAFWHDLWVPGCLKSAKTLQIRPKKAISAPRNECQNQGSQHHGKPGKWKKHFPDLEKSWNLKKRAKSWKNHGISKYLYGKVMEKIFELDAHYPKRICAVCAYPYDDNEFGVVCFILCGEGVTKNVEATVRKVNWYTTNHHLCRVDHGKNMKGSWKIMEKSWNLNLGNRWEPCYIWSLWKNFGQVASLLCWMFIILFYLFFLGSSLCLLFSTNSDVKLSTSSWSEVRTRADILTATRGKNMEHRYLDLTFYLHT